MRVKGGIRAQGEQTQGQCLWAISWDGHVAGARNLKAGMNR